MLGNRVKTHNYIKNHTSKGVNNGFVICCKSNGKVDSQVSWIDC